MTPRHMVEPFREGRVKPGQGAGQKGAHFPFLISHPSFAKRGFNLEVQRKQRKKPLQNRAR